MMRVLFVSHTYLLRITQKILDVISQKGVTIGLLAPKNWRPLNGLFAGRCFPLERCFDSFRIYGGGVIRSGHVASYLFMPWSIWKVMHDFRPEIVHIDEEVYSLTSAHVALVAKTMKKKVVVYGAENLDRKIHFTQKVARKIVLSLTDAIISCSTGGTELLQKWGFHGSIEIIQHLGIDPSLFYPRKKMETTLLTIGFVGRLVKEKGVDVLLCSLRVLADKGYGFEVSFCGSGPCKQEWIELSHKLSIADMITWIGVVPHQEVPEIMSRLDILVLPSRTLSWSKEQFGHVLTQAMAMGIPVVGSSCGAIPEVIGRDDVIFPEENHIALASILERMLQSPEWRQELSEYGIERVREHFTSDCIADRLVSLYESLLKRR